MIGCYLMKCEHNKLIFLNRLNKYRNDPNDENRQDMVNARSTFKSSVRKYMLDCRKRKTQHLLESKYKNAKEYWKLLKDTQKHPESRSLSEQKFADYFRAINDPNMAFYQADEDAIFFNIYILGVFTGKPYSKPLEHNVVYIPIITLRHATSHDFKWRQINHGSLQSDWTSATSWRHWRCSAVSRQTACKCFPASMLALISDFNVLIEINVNISNELNFSDVYRSVNYIGSLAKITYSLCTRPIVVYTSINLRKMKFIP